MSEERRPTGICPGIISRMGLGLFGRGYWELQEESASLRFLPET